jgi:hypothetical protein
MLAGKYLGELLKADAELRAIAEDKAELADARDSHRRLIEGLAAAGTLPGSRVASPFDCNRQDCA